MLLIFLFLGVGFFPLIAGEIIMEQNREFGSIVLAISPITGITNAGGIGIGDANLQAVQAAAIGPAVVMALLFFGLLISEERKLQQEVRAEHAGPRKKKAKDDLD